MICQTLNQHGGIMMISYYFQHHNENDTRTFIPFIYLFIYIHLRIKTSKKNIIYDRQTLDAIVPALYLLYIH